MMIYSVMTQEKFREVLDERRYSYKIEGGKVIVTGDGYVDLRSLTSLPPGVVFKNGGGVDLGALTSLPPGVVFNNEGSVYLGSLVGGSFNRWKGNIEGIDSKRLLNVMISLGLFER